MKKIKDRGYIAFSSLLVISAVALAVSISIALQGVSEAQASLAYKKGRESFYAAQGCAEEALSRLKDNVNYTGSTPTLGITVCTIIVSGTGANRTINVTATIPGPPTYTKRLQLGVTRKGGSINILSWLETN